MRKLRSNAKAATPIPKSFDPLAASPRELLKLGIDCKTHPAWTGVHRLVDSGGQLAKFKKRFKDFGLKE